jgi:hypothetical protein
MGRVLLIEITTTNIVIYGDYVTDVIVINNEKLVI